MPRKLKRPTRVYKAVRSYDRRAHHSHLYAKFYQEDFYNKIKRMPRDVRGRRNLDALDTEGRAPLGHHSPNSRWNRWRRRYGGRPDLRGIDLTGDLLLHFAEFYFTDLAKSVFAGMLLRYVDFRHADLTSAELQRSRIWYCALDGANLSNANLGGADFSRTSLIGANLSGANLQGANLTNCDLSGANLSNCNIYGVSAWDVTLTGAVQSNLVITPPDEPAITVDNLEVAQFVYLLLKSEKLRAVLDTLTSKVVLILGRFTVERKAVLDAIREALRSHGYLPVLFDFEKPSSRDLTETITTLAHLSRFIIADLTDPKSVPHELANIIPTLAVPVQPIIIATSRPYAMFEDFQRKYRWVLETYYYQDLETLLADLTDKVIAPAEQRFSELAGR
jgi:hypothetical protein